MSSPVDGGCQVRYVPQLVDALEMREDDSGVLHEEGEDAVDVIRLVGDVAQRYVEICGQRRRLQAELPEAHEGLMEQEI